MKIFSSGDILLPKEKNLERWAVIACDQFTSDIGYWQRVRKYVGELPSTLHMILPEAELGTAAQCQVLNINQAMEQYLQEGIFTEYTDAYIYVERTLESGAVRPGIVGIVDLEAYDYHSGAVSPIRATERTVLERIPPRKRVRQGAPLEFPHVIMLCDDDMHMLLESVTKKRNTLPKLYDFTLMEGGGHIEGWLLQGKDARAFDCCLEAYIKKTEEKYADLTGAKVYFAVGDGNHSLATAKSCYEEQKTALPAGKALDLPARYALVELENIHDPSLKFEPIHRIITSVDEEKLLKDLEDICKPEGYPVKWCSGKRSGTVYLDRERGALAVAVLQDFLDAWLEKNPGVIDYIHGAAETERLASYPGAVGFLLPAMEKGQLFPGVISGGVLPRKTFSMGNAREKRYYLEGRKIK